MKNFYLLLSLLFPFSLFAQSNYQSGFVLKNNGDTLKGFINYREWTFSPRSIDFKTNKDDKQPIQFNPQTIKCFQVSGAETYVSYTGLVTMNRTEINEISNGLDTTKKSDTLFIKQVASGNNLRLFYEHDDIKTRFFIAGLNEKPTELKNFVSYNSGELANSPIYKGQLVLYVNKFKPRDEKILNKINEAGYNQADLENIVNQINDVRNLVKKKSNLRFYAGGGLNFTTVTVGNSFLTTYSSKYSGITPKLNLGIDIFDNPNVQQFAIRADFSLFYVSPNFSSFGINPETNTNQSYTFNQYSIALSPQVVYNFYNKPHFKIFIGGGISFNFASYSNNKTTVAAGTNSSSSIITDPHDLQPFYASFPFNAGLAINKKVEIEVTFVPNASYTKQVFFSITNQTTGFAVKYLFSK